MNIVIVGNGKVGFALAEELAKENHDITLIDTNGDKLEHSAELLDITYAVGNGASYLVQRDANVQAAELFIAATSTDEVNMLCCLMASKLGCKNTIARVRNPEYDEHLYLLEDELGLSMSINPERAAAVEIARLISYPSAISAGSFVKGRADLIEIRLGEDSGLCGQNLAEIRRKYPVNILIYAVERGEKLFIPSGDFVLMPNDNIHLSGNQKRIVEFLRLVNSQGRKIKSVLIIGGGSITYYLAKMLLEIGIGVRIIEMSRSRCEELCRLLPPALVIEGDGTERDLLAEVGLGEVDAFIALTDIDEENLIISMYAAKEGVPKVITKLNRLSYLDVVKNTGIDSIVSPKQITATQIIQYVRAKQNTGGSQVKALYRIANDKAEVMEFVATSSTVNVGKKLKDCRIRKNTLIAALVHDGGVIIPHGDDIINEGDSVIIVTSVDEPLMDLNGIFLK